jgi:nicotinate-nucleotide adenylyltransferase
MHPEHDFSLVIGSDLQDDVASWYRGDELQRTIPFIVIGRPGSPERSGVTMPDVSSTAVRAALAAGKPAEGLVPRSVLDYILRKGLYQEQA